MFLDGYIAHCTTVYYPYIVQCMRFYSTEGLKYFVERTKIGRNLPIYTEYRNGGNACFTLIKRISGDTRRLSDDLMKYLTSNKKEAEIEAKNISVDISVDESRKNMEKLKNKWRIREELGHIWVHGKHTGIVRKFLESKGF